MYLAYNIINCNAHTRHTHLYLVKNDTNYVEYAEKLGREYYDVELNTLECFTLLDVHLGLYTRKK